MNDQHVIAVLKKKKNQEDTATLSKKKVNSSH